MMLKAFSCYIGQAGDRIIDFGHSILGGALGVAGELSACRATEAAYYSRSGAAERLSRPRPRSGLPAYPQAGLKL